MPPGRQGVIAEPSYWPRVFRGVPAGSVLSHGIREARPGGCNVQRLHCRERCRAPGCKNCRGTSREECHAVRKNRAPGTHDELTPALADGIPPARRRHQPAAPAAFCKGLIVSPVLSQRTPRRSHYSNRRSENVGTRPRRYAGNPRARRPSSAKPARFVDAVSRTVVGSRPSGGPAPNPPPRERRGILR
jgi:hypothetical protein